MLTAVPLLADITGILPCFCVAGMWGGFFLVAVLGSVFWIWMLVEAITKEPSEGNDKIIWILIILFAHLLGAALYYFVRRPERKRKFGK